MIDIYDPVKCYCNIIEDKCISIHTPVLTGETLTKSKSLGLIIDINFYKSYSFYDEIDYEYIKEDYIISLKEEVGIQDIEVEFPEYIPYLIEHCLRKKDG